MEHHQTDQGNPRRDVAGEVRFFAAANTVEGFRNYYPACFGEQSPVERLFVIHGGPGTGKSRFMRDVARFAVGRGYEAVYYYCSSDPGSLDGVRLSKPGRPCIGCIDGTAPHVWTPRMPGAFEEWVHLDAFWDADQLRTRREAIASIGRAKSAAYADAYRLLAACGQVRETADARITPAVDEVRLHALAGRMLRGEPAPSADISADTSGGIARLTPALRRALGMTGDVCFHTFEHLARRITVIRRFYGVGSRLMAHLLEVIQTRELQAWVSYDPLNPAVPDGLFFPATGYAILLENAEPRTDIACHTLSLRRSVDAPRLHDLRPELRRLAALQTDLLTNALVSLSRAADRHFDLESIYSSAMDFPKKESFTASFCHRHLD